MAYDPDDPRLIGYIPIEDFRITDADYSSRHIRDNPKHNILLNRSLYDFNIDVPTTPYQEDDWNL